MLHPGLITALPVIILFLGATSASVLDKFTLSRYSKVLRLSTIGGAIVALLYLRGHLPSTATISDWLPTAFSGRKLTYYVDDLSFTFSLLLTSVGLAVFIAPSGESTTSLAVLAAGLSFILSADLITLCFSWVLLDFTLLRTIVAVKNGFKKGFYSLAASYLSVFGLVSVASLLAEEGQSLSLSSILLRPRALNEALLLLAIFVRACLHPLPTGDDEEQASSTLLHLVPTGAGLYLLARFYTSFSGDSPLLAILGVLSFFVGAFLAFCEPDPKKALFYFLINRVGYVFLSTAYDEDIFTFDKILLSSINLTLCFGILSLAREKYAVRNKARDLSKVRLVLMRLVSAIRHKYRIQLLAPIWLKEAISRLRWSSLIAGVAIASVAGMPITLGFIGLASFYRSLFTRGNWFLLTMIPLAEAFLLASLFRQLASLPDALPRFSAGSALLCIPILLLGIHPPLLGIMAPFQAEFATLAAVLRSTKIAPWLALLLPPIGGYVLYRRSEVVLKRLKIFEDFLRLDWLYFLLERTTLAIANIVQAVGELIEGKGYPGWITIFILIVFLLL